MVHGDGSGYHILGLGLACRVVGFGVFALSAGKFWPLSAGRGAIESNGTRNFEAQSITRKGLLSLKKRVRTCRRVFEYLNAGEQRWKESR